MEFKGTKGPWERQKQEIIGDSKYIGFACNYLMDEKIGNEEAKSNAQLISKAPELLEALRHSLKILEECNPPDYLVETYGNAIMNYQGLIKEATTV